MYLITLNKNKHPNHQAINENVKNAAKQKNTQKLEKAKHNKNSKYIIRK